MERILRALSQRYWLVQDQRTDVSSLRRSINPNLDTSTVLSVLFCFPSPPLAASSGDLNGLLFRMKKPSNMRIRFTREMFVNVIYRPARRIKVSD